MKKERFDEIVKARGQQSLLVLTAKGKEYGRGDDHLHNINRAALYNQEHPASTVWHGMVKHLTSIADLVDDLNVHSVRHGYHVWNEKIGDAINYLILLEAVILEDLEKERGKDESSLRWYAHAAEPTRDTVGPSDAPSVRGSVLDLPKSPRRKRR